MKLSPPLAALFRVRFNRAGEPDRPMPSCPSCGKDRLAGMEECPTDGHPQRSVWCQSCTWRAIFSGAPEPTN